MQGFDPSLVEWDHGTARFHQYPDIATQLDMLWHDINNGIFGESAKDSTWFKALQSVKTDYPKGQIVKPYVE